MDNKPKRQYTKSTKKKVTAKSFHKNLKIDFFSKNNELENDLDNLDNDDFEKSSSKPKKFFSELELLMKNDIEYEKTVENSEEFFDILFNYNSSTDLNNLVVFDKISIDNLFNNINNNNHSMVPFLVHTDVSSYGLILIKPNSKFGPIINTRGLMILLFLNVPDNKVYFISNNLVDKKRRLCKDLIQFLIVPNDIFIIYNESNNISSKLLIITCKQKWQGIEYIKDIKKVSLKSM